MTPVRLFAIALIFAFTTAAWMVLGGTLVSRTGEQDGALRHEVEQLWGGEHTQQTPMVLRLIPTERTRDVDEHDAHGDVVKRRVTEMVIERAPASLTHANVDVKLDLENRKKGLLWYPTYTVALRGDYRFVNDDNVPRMVEVGFAFPSALAIYDRFTFTINGVEAPPAGDLRNGPSSTVEVPAHGAVDVVIGYTSRGLGTWRYAFGDGVSHVKDFTLTLHSNVGALDFPTGTLSPSTSSDSGRTLTWKFDNLVTGQNIGVVLPAKLNPGPVASRISFFAPVSLLFFFSVVVILGVVRKRSMHPMNYVFLAASFFAFHLLLAYLVDVVDIGVAFATASACSVFLVVSYLRIVLGTGVMLVQAAVAQLVFLVGFGAAFFVEGQTGLSIAVGAVVTLFVLMQLTARTKWAEVFAKGTHDRGSAVGIPPSMMPSMNLSDDDVHATHVR